MFVWLRVILIMLFSVVVLSCSQDEPSTQQGVSREMESIRLGIAIQPASALIIIADEKDMFAENGLDAEIKEYPSGKRALSEGLYSGQADFVSSADMPVAMGILQQQDLQIVATTLLANNVNRIIARKSSGISTPADLRGKRVATQRLSAVHYFLYLFLLEQGLMEFDVEMVFMKEEKLSGALVAGEIDAFSMREPYISMAKDKLGDQSVVFETPEIYNQVDLVLTNSHMVKNKAPTIEKLILSLLAAESFIKKHPEQSIALIAQRLGVAEAEIAEIWPTVLLQVSMDQSLLLLLENQARWAIARGVTEEQAIPNYLEHFYLDALKTIKPQAVTVIE